MIKIQDLVDCWKTIEQMHKEFEQNKDKSKYTFDEINQMHKRYGYLKIHIMNEYGYSNAEINEIVSKELNKQ